MKLFLRLMLVGGLCWLGYGNLRLLDGVAGALRHVRDSTGSKIEMVQVARFVQMDYLDRNVLPEGDLTPLILENLRADSRAITAKSGRDPWGGAYWCLAAKGGFHVASAGPDRRWRTKDDIFFFQNLSGLGYNGPAPVARPASLARPASPRKPPVAAGVILRASVKSPPDN